MRTNQHTKNPGLVRGWSGVGPGGWSVDSGRLSLRLPPEDQPTSAQHPKTVGPVTLETLSIEVGPMVLYRGISIQTGIFDGPTPGPTPPKNGPTPRHRGAP